MEEHMQPLVEVVRGLFRKASSRVGLSEKSSHCANAQRNKQVKSFTWMNVKVRIPIEIRHPHFTMKSRFHSRCKASAPNIESRLVNSQVTTLLRHLIVLLVVICSGRLEALAQAKLKVLFLDRNGERRASSDGQDSAVMGNSFPSLVSWGDTGSVFDPYYLDNLGRLAYETNPRDNPNDFDPERAQEVAQKALTVKLADTFNRTIVASELHDEYREVIKTVSRLKRIVNYSVQKSGNGYQVSRDRKGKKLVEFQVEPSTRTGLSPQLKVGEMGRVRYDMDRQGMIFELRGKW